MEEKFFPKTKILFAFRFFSGLSGVRLGRWRPEGATSIARILEGVSARGIESTVFFLCKTPKESIGVVSTQRQSIEALPNVHFTILPWRAWTTIDHIDRPLNGIVHFFSIVLAVLRLRPSLLYIDRINLPIGAFFAWVRKPTVVVRMLGVAEMKETLASLKNNILHPLRSFALRAPFACVITSKDGSPSEDVLKTYLHSKTQSVVWLNGVDPHPINHNALTHDRTMPPRLLFVGRLEKDKRCLDFIEALIIMRDDDPTLRFSATLLGSGSLQSEVERRITNARLDLQVRVAGGVSHEEVLQEYRNADVYVSLNRLGNLSNTVLEALRMGMCSIILAGDGVVDRDTDAILDADTVLRVSRHNTAKDLAKCMGWLVRHPEKIAVYAARAYAYSEQYIPTWDERIEKEITLLERLAR